MDDFIRWAKERLTDERLTHTRGVVALARSLSLAHGVDEIECNLAAWLHDALKAQDGSELLLRARDMGLPEDLTAPPFVLHATVMGRISMDRFGASEAVGEAISYHPMGRPNLGPVGKVTYLADKLEEGRRYPGVEVLREVARRDLDRGFHLTLEANVRFLVGEGRTPHPLSIRTLEAYRRRSTVD